MFRPRLIPTLLLKNDVLVKSVKFKNHKYIGDPINAVKIFNELKADELVLLDIDATSQGRRISSDVIRRVGEEANMPFSVGGGISSIADIKEIIACGAEKVVLNSYAISNPDFIKHAVDYFGSSTIVVCLDIKKNFWGTRNDVFVKNGKKATKLLSVEAAKKVEAMGAGEIIVQSIDCDGSMRGYDIELIKSICDSVSIPTTALGGAGTIQHIRDLCKSVNVTGIAAGSFFVYQGINKGVLINYPSWKDVIKLD